MLMMKDQLTIAFFSAADWFDPKVWIDLFATLEETLSISPQKYCLTESKWFPFVSMEATANDMTVNVLNDKKTVRKEYFSWTIRFDGRSFANLDLWKRSTEMYNECRFRFPGDWVSNDSKRTSLRLFFERAVSNMLSFYGSMDLVSIVSNESSPGRAFYNLRYEFPTFNWMSFFSNAVISFFGKGNFGILPCRILNLPTGMVFTFGETPEEADLNRNRKLAAEKILGMDSFVVPAAFPPIDSSSERWRQSMWRLDPAWHLPRMLDGSRKPQYTYVPTFETLAAEFAPPNSNPPTEHQ